MGGNQSVRHALACGAAAVLVTGAAVGGGLALHASHHAGQTTPTAAAIVSPPPVDRGAALSRSFDRGSAPVALGDDGRHRSRLSPHTIEHHFRVVRRRAEIEHRRAVAAAEASASAAAKAAKQEAPAALPAAPVSVTKALEEIAQCESGGNWADDTGNGYYGGLQFSLGTWQAYGGTGLPSDASEDVQIAIAAKMVKADGGSYGAWPACSAEYGLPQ